MSSAVLTLVGAFWATFGVACLVAPASMLAMAAIEFTSAQSATEIRAMYGGAQVGFGIFLFYASRVPQFVKPALLVLAFIMAGFAIGRLYGIALDRAFDSVTLASLAVETALFVLAALALSREHTVITARAT